MGFEPMLDTFEDGYYNYYHFRPGFIVKQSKVDKTSSIDETRRGIV